MKTGKMKTSKMKTSINLKTRKMKNNYLKLGMMAAVMLSASIGFAQTSTGSGASVRVIDNKGTIKYLQTNNGITSITSTAPGNKTTTTWQLGGTLTEATTITTDGTNTLNIAGLEENTDAAATTAIGTSGYTLVVRDEATGALKKLLAADILDAAAITGIRLEDIQAADATGNVDITVTGLPVLDAGTSASKLSVYRNGVKLRFGSDFVAALGLVTITYDAADLPMYANDVIEIQYLK